VRFLPFGFTAENAEKNRETELETTTQQGSCCFCVVSSISSFAFSLCGRSLPAVAGDLCGKKRTAND
jgi:hypothetical protein